MATVRELTTVWGFDVRDAPLRRVESSLQSIKRLAIRTAVLIGVNGLGLGLLARQLSNFEQIEVAFETIIGDVKLAQKKIGELRKFAEKTPFTISGVFLAAKQLLSVKIATDDLLPTMKSLGDVAAGVSVPLFQIVKNFGQIKTQGKLTSRELLDFNRAGIPLIDELTKVLGVNENQISSLVTAGKVSFDDVVQAFKNMSSEGGIFFNLMDKQSKTLGGIFNNIQDNLQNLVIDIGKAGLLGAMKKFLNDILSALNINRKELLEGTASVVKTILGFTKDLISLFKVFKNLLKPVIRIFGGWAKAIKLVTKAIVLLISLKFLVFLGSAAQGTALYVKGLIALRRAAFAATAAQGGLIAATRTFGNVALIAQAKALAIPLAIGAAIAGFLLIMEDLIVFSQGGKSVFGVILVAWDIFLTRMVTRASKFRQELANEFKDVPVLNLFTGQGTAKEGTAFIKRVKEAANTVARGFVLGGPVGAAIGAGSVVGADLGTRIINTFNITADGLTGQQASDAVQNGVKESMDNMLREAGRDAKPQVRN